MKKIYLYTSVLILGIFFAGCRKQNQTTESMPEIEVAEAYEDSIVLHQSFPGVVTSGGKVDVKIQVNGRLLDCHFGAGNFVNKGDLLFTIDPALYRDAVQRAEANLATARSQYDYYTKRYAALSKALEADAVSKMEVIQAKSNMDQAAASISESEAALRTARLNLSYCRVTAPISGYISAPSPDPGNYIMGEGSPVTMCQIYDISHVTANFYVSDDQYALLVAANGGLDSKVYRKVPLIFREPLQHEYTTDLYYDAPSVNQENGTLLLQGRIENPERELKDGMYTTISLPYGENPHAVLVKDASIGTDQLGKYVYLVNDSNKVVYRPIKVGELYNDSLRVVESGIKAGDRYVSKALLKVRRGETIKPVLKK